MQTSLSMNVMAQGYLDKMGVELQKCLGCKTKLMQLIQLLVKVRSKFMIRVKQILALGGGTGGYTTGRK